MGEIKMTNDKQIEVWQSEFESIYADHGMTFAIFNKKPGGLGYLDFHTDCLWTGFLIAKRSMQPIELPSYDTHCFDEVDLKDLWSHSRESIINAITAAGYSYRVKE